MTEMMNQANTEDLSAMSLRQLADLADSLRCPDGFRTPFNSRPLPMHRGKLTAMIQGHWQRRADSAAIARQAR